MKKTIGECATHEKAIEAVQELIRFGYPVQHLALVGKAMIVDHHMVVRNNNWEKNVPAIVGAVLGPILGSLIGLKIIAIPGFGFLYGTGVMIGALAGFSIGIVAGGIVSLINTIIIKKRYVLKYAENSKEQGFHVIAYGNIEEVNKAKKILYDFMDETNSKVPENSPTS